MTTHVNINNSKDISEIVNGAKALTKPDFIIYAEMLDFNHLADAIHLTEREFYFIETTTKDERVDLYITDIASSKYELAVRTFDRDKTTYTDVVSDITPEVFGALRNLANIGYKFKYYNVVAANTSDIWHISVFYTDSGIPHPWVRLEIELNDKTDVTNVPKLPFPIGKAIIEGDPNNTLEEKQRIANLWIREYSKIDKRDIIRV